MICILQCLLLTEKDVPDDINEWNDATAHDYPEKSLLNESVWIKITDYFWVKIIDASVTN
jgi:hypothetical protein